MNTKVTFLSVNFQPDISLHVNTFYREDTIHILLKTAAKLTLKTLKDKG